MDWRMEDWWWLVVILGAAATAAVWWFVGWTLLRMDDAKTRRHEQMFNRVHEHDRTTREDDDGSLG